MLISTLFSFKDSPSPLTLLQQQQRQKYGLRNYNGANDHAMSPHNNGVSRYDSLSYDEITESDQKVSSRDKNFWNIAGKHYFR